MSSKSKKIVHYGTYVPYTGNFALCRVDSPELDSLPFISTKDIKKVTCKECLLELLQ